MIRVAIASKEKLITNRFEGTLENQLRLMEIYGRASFLCYVYKTRSTKPASDGICNGMEWLVV